MKHWPAVALSVGFVLTIAGCQCETGAQQRVYACLSDDGCASGFHCSPEGLCVADGTGGGAGGGAMGGGAGGGDEDGGTGGGAMGGGAGGGGATGGGAGGGGATGGGTGGGATGGGTGGGATGGGTGGGAMGGGAGGGATGGGTGGGATGGGGGASCTPTGPEDCTNMMVDEDCNGLTECADPACFAQACQVGSPQNVCTSTSTCACGIGPPRTLTASDTASGSASAVELNGRVRVVWANEYTIWYAECSSNCSTSSPTFSTPIALMPEFSNPEVRPELRLMGSTLVAFVHDGLDDGGVRYLECSSNCATLSNWSYAEFTEGTYDDVSALDVLGTLRATAYETENGWVWAECSGGCTQTASWTGLEFTGAVSGASIVLSPLTDGGVLRRFLRGNSSGSSFYMECEGTTATCTGGASAWSTATLPQTRLQNPVLVVDGRGLPRAFGQDGFNDRLAMQRCTQQPCTANANWTNKQALTDGGYWIAAGLLLDGGTWWFGHNDAFEMTIGTEIEDGGYALRGVFSCGGTSVFGNSGTLVPTASGRMHIFYGEDFNTSLRYRRELP